MREALFWKPLGEAGAVQCRLCRQYCKIDPGGRGLCGVRQNVDGALYTLVFEDGAAHVAALNLDPVEKKPLYHFLPGAMTFSLGTMGCNLSCAFCQNYSLSQPPRGGGDMLGRLVTPEQLVAEALRLDAASISYTYSEPTIFFELVKPTAELALEKGLANIIVSNGYMSPECLEAMGGLIQAANIDLKAFTDAFYRDICGARLGPVLDNLRVLAASDIWLEVTTLLVTGANDSDEEIAAMARFVAEELGRETPWHVSRFSPVFRMTDRGPTPLDRLEAAWEAGRAAGLDYVYVGNSHGHKGQHTYCPDCGRVAVRREGFRILEADPGVCEVCGRPLAGVGWERFS